PLRICHRRPPIPTTGCGGSAGGDHRGTGRLPGRLLGSGKAGGRCGTKVVWPLFIWLNRVARRKMGPTTNPRRGSREQQPPQRATKVEPAGQFLLSQGRGETKGDAAR